MTRPVGIEPSFCAPPRLTARPEKAPADPADKVTLGAAPAAAKCSPLEEKSVRLMWGGTGHSTINASAASNLPEDMPEFFRTAGDRLEALASQPDRWKFRSLPRLNVINRPDHHINMELIGDRTLPPERYGFVNMIAAEHLQQDGDAPQDVGFLPYAIAENLEKLTAELALWRREVGMNGEATVLARQLADNAVYTAGLLGHYTGDASQPLHVTAHFDGWQEAVEPNPDQFSTARGIHYRFESLFVNASNAADEVAARLQPARALEGDTLEIANEFCQNSHRNVRTLYQLDRDGKLDPDAPSQEGKEFAVGCLVDGTQFLRDLWYTAWVRSADLASQALDPQSALAGWNLGPLE